jgi:hypothetical protein
MKVTWFQRTEGNESDMVSKNREMKVTWFQSTERNESDMVSKD